MSQQHSENGESSRHAASDGQRSPPSYARPNYMTVGSGSTSEHADRLAQMLNDNDSGYGSMSSRQPFDATTAGDRPLPDGLNLSSLSCKLREHPLTFTTANVLQQILASSLIVMTRTGPDLLLPSAKPYRPSFNCRSTINNGLLTIPPPSHPLRSVSNSILVQISARLSQPAEILSVPLFLDPRHFAEQRPPLMRTLPTLAPRLSSSRLLPMSRGS